MEQAADLPRDDASPAAALRLRAFLEHAGDAFFVAALDGRLVDANASACAALGYRRDELLALAVADIDPDHADPERLAAVARKLVPGQSLLLETRHRRKDGTSFPVEMRLSLVDVGGERVVVAFARDITERRRREDLLAARVRLSHAASNGSSSDLLRAFLDEAEAMTGSEIGFFHFVEADQHTLSLQEWSTNTVRSMCTAEGRGRHYDVDQAGVWADCLRLKRPVVHNDYPALPGRRGLPPGHAPVTRELVVPVCRGGTVVAILGVGNKPAPYDDSDVATLSALADEAWDIVVRKRTEEALGASELRQKATVLIALDGFWHVGLDGRFLDVSDTAAAMLGSTRDEMLGRGLGLADVEANESTVDVERHIERILRIGRDRFESRHRRCDGSIIDVEVSAAYSESGGGSFLVFVRDITEQRAARQALAASERRFRGLFEASPVGIAVVDLTGHVLACNSALCELLGYREEELRAMTFADFTHPDDVAADLGQFRAMLSGGPGFEMDKRYVTKRGDVVWAHLRVAMIRGQDGGGDLVIGIIQDLSERRRREEEQRRLQTMLRQSQKMEAIGTLAGGIAHDFNNILSAILGYAELARDDAGDVPVLRDEIAEILTAGRRAKDLVAQILAFSRQRETERRPLRLEPVVKEVLRLVRASIPATVEIASSIRTGGGLVLADPTQVHQLVMNLCSNAYGAMVGRGGLLEVSLEQREIGPAEAATFVGLSPGPHALLTVRDTGCGMDAQVLEHLFEPYFTTKGPGEGTGMGLAVVHAIVKAHDGAITVDSEPGVGSTFRVYLPVRQLAASEAGDDEAGLSPEGRERVLFVDDEKAIRAIAKAGLERFGFKVELAVGPVEAVDDFRRAPDRFDVVVTDLSMPGMNGIELARQVREIRADVPVVLCSGFLHSGYESQASLVGITELVDKPIHLAKLGWAIRRALDAASA